MGWDFITALADVDFGGAVGVDGITLVGVDGDAEEARVGVDEPGDVTTLQVVQDRGVVEVCQVRHVLAFLELGGVNLANQVLLEVLGFTGWNHYGDKIALSSLDLTKIETVVIIRNPASSLTIVRLA